MPAIVITHRNLPVERQNIELYAGDLHELVNEWLKPNYKNVWVVGGAFLAKDFIALRLADEIRLPVLLIILGNGLPLFDGA